MEVIGKSPEFTSGWTTKMFSAWIPGLLFSLFWFGNSSASPVVIAVDASLERRSMEMAIEVTTTIGFNSSEESPVGLVVFDDVVQHSVALDVSTDTRANEFDKVLGAISRSKTGNLAAGIERGLDDLRASSSATLIVFTRGVIDTLTNDSRARYQEWLTAVLLPDANDKNIAISIVTPSVGADNSLVASFLEYPLNKHILFDSETSDPVQIANLFLETDDGVGRPSVPVVTDVKIAGSSDVTSTTGTFDTSATSDIADTTSTTDTSGTPVSTMAAADTSSRLTDVKAISNDLDRFRFIWFSCLATLVVVLLSLFFWLIRNRRKNEMSGRSAVSNRSSTYLPIDVLPSGRLDALNVANTNEHIADWGVSEPLTEDDERAIVDSFKSSMDTENAPTNDGTTRLSPRNENRHKRPQIPEAEVTVIDTGRKRRVKSAHKDPVV